VCPARRHNIDFDVGRAEHADKRQPDTGTNRFSIPLAALLSAANLHDPDRRLLETSGCACGESTVSFRRTKR